MLVLCSQLGFQFDVIDDRLETEKGIGPPNAGGLWMDVSYARDVSMKFFADIRRSR